MTRSIRISFLSLLGACLLTACSSSATKVPEIDPVYGVELAEIYDRKKVKEVFVERDHFYERKLLYPRYLTLYMLLDKDGRTVRKEAAHNDRISRRLDTTYDTDGGILSTVSYEILPGTSENRSGREGIEWTYAERILHAANGKESAGKYTWSVSEQQWRQQTVLRTWESNDTTYTEERDTYGTYGQSRKLTRDYLLGSDNKVLRHDYLTFSPKGMGDPRYSFTRVEEGRVMEHGQVDYEYELYAYVEKNPGKQRYMFSKNGYNMVLDELARQSPGRMVPNMTYKYNGKGQLILANEFQTEITYERDADGRATAKRERHMGGGSGIISRYYYNPEGLLTHEVKTTLRGEPSETLYYRYTFY